MNCLAILKTTMKKFISNRSGVAIIEYNMSAAVLLLACAISVSNFNQAVKTTLYCSTPDQKNANAKVCGYNGNHFGTIESSSNSNAEQANGNTYTDANGNTQTIYNSKTNGNYGNNYGS